MAVSITVIDDLDRCVRATLAAIHEESATVAYAHIFDSPFPTEDTRQRWDRYEGSVAVARDGDAVIGFVAWYDDECDALYVRPSAAGAGVGACFWRRHRLPVACGSWRTTRTHDRSTHVGAGHHRDSPADRTATCKSSNTSATCQAWADVQERVYQGHPRRGTPQEAAESWGQRQRLPGYSSAWLPTSCCAAPLTHGHAFIGMSELSRPAPLTLGAHRFGRHALVVPGAALVVGVLPGRLLERDALDPSAGTHALIRAAPGAGSQTIRTWVGDQRGTMASTCPRTGTWTLT